MALTTAHPHSNDEESIRRASTHQVQQQEQQHVPHSSLATSSSIWFHELYIQLTTAAPTFLGLVLAKVPWLVSLRFLGSLQSNHELAAASFANSLANITGMAVAVALSSALATLTSQARGELQQRRKKKQVVLEEDRLMRGTTTEAAAVVSTIELKELLPPNDNDDIEIVALTHCGSTDIGINPSTQPLLTPLVYLYRGLFMNLLFLVPMTLFWVLGGMGAVLRQIGQDEAILQLTLQYLKILAPGMIGATLHRTLQEWLQAMGLARIVPWFGAIGFLLHIPTNYVFMYKLNVWNGFVGNAWATVVYQILQLIMLVFYLTTTRHGQQQIFQAIYPGADIDTGSFELLTTSRELCVATHTGFRQYLMLALPSLVSISEWWSSELSIVLAGRLPVQPDVALGSMTLFQSLNSMCFMLPLSWSVAGTMRVGYHLGAGQAILAKRSSRVCITAALSCSMVLCLLIRFGIPYSFLPSLFAPDSEELVGMTSLVIPLLAIYIVGDAMAASFNSVMKGCGRQAIVMPIVVVAYWVVGVPLGYFLAFGEADKGVVGLVTGTTTGTWVHGALLALIVLGFTNWQHEADAAQERVQRVRQAD